MTAVSPILGGMGMGIVHALTGPDHMSALVTVAVNERCKAFWLGARWGVGHSGGLLIVTILMLVLRDTYGVDEENMLAEVSHVMNWFVGIAMLALGLWSYYRAFQLRRRYLGLPDRTFLRLGQKRASARCQTGVRDEQTPSEVVVARHLDSFDIEMSDSVAASPAAKAQAAGTAAAQVELSTSTADQGGGGGGGRREEDGGAAEGRRARANGAPGGASVETPPTTREALHSCSGQSRCADDAPPALAEQAGGVLHTHHEHGDKALRLYRRFCRCCPQARGAPRPPSPRVVTRPPRALAPPVSPRAASPHPARLLRPLRAKPR